MEDDVNTTETTGGRVAARWTPNDDWTLDISALYQETNADGFADANIEVGGLEQVRFAEEKLNEEWYQIGLTLQGNLGFADALVHTSYFNRDFRYDADGTDYQFAFNQVFDDAYYDGTPNPDFNPDSASLNGLPPGSWEGNSNWFFGAYDETIEQFAIFGEMSFDFTENFTITTGGAGSGLNVISTWCRAVCNRMGSSPIMPRISSPPMNPSADWIMGLCPR